VQYLLRDRLGSVIGIADDAGTVEWRGFDAFGAPRSGTWADKSPNILGPSTATAHGFTQHEHLDGLGLIHMNGRVYDYALGRFLGVDPFIQFPSNSQSLNPYSYILNNPLAGTDPTGYEAKSPQNDQRSICFRTRNCLGVSFTDFKEDEDRNSRKSNGKSQGHKSTGARGVNGDGSDVSETEKAVANTVDFTVGFARGAANSEIQGLALSAALGSLLTGNFIGAANLFLQSSQEFFTPPDSNIGQFGFDLGPTASILLGGTPIAALRKLAPRTVESLRSPLQQLTTRAAREIDSLGDQAFTPAQLRAILNNPRLQPLFRGLQIDKMVRKLVEVQPELAARVTGRINKGVDFTDSATGEIFDITTRAQTQAKIKKFGPKVQVLETDP
jgi:RHS repeat-associated protein